MDIKDYLKEQLSKRPWLREDVIKKAHQIVADNNISIEELTEKLIELDNNYFKVYDRMKNKAPYYLLSNIFFECKVENIITISCKYKYQEISGDYEVLIIPILNYDYQATKQYSDVSFKVSAIDNKIHIPVNFPEEQSYRITLWKLDFSGNRHLFVEYNVYALEKDLFELKYLKGDLHCHTTYSDGYEPPEQVACSARKYGCDFIAITDHNQYDGSVVAEEWVKNNGGSITIIRGEEYSCVYTPLHILSLGAPNKLDSYNYSSQCIYNNVGDLHLDNRISSILQTEKHIISDPLAFACTQFLFDRIRENGGISVLCHPMWKPLGYNGKRSDAPLSLIKDLIYHKNFDAFEVVSGSQLGESYVSGLQHCIAVDAMKPQEFTYIGITDSHYYSSDPISGKHFTVVFSKDTTAEKILEGLRLKRSVAVEIDENGKATCYGQLRYVLFTYFLLKEYFPQKDLIAYEDGKKMETKLMCY